MVVGYCNSPSPLSTPVLEQKAQRSTRPLRFFLFLSFVVRSPHPFAHGHIGNPRCSGYQLISCEQLVSTAGRATTNCTNSRYCIQSSHPPFDFRRLNDLSFRAPLTWPYESPPISADLRRTLPQSSIDEVHHEHDRPATASGCSTNNHRRVHAFDRGQLCSGKPERLPYRLGLVHIPLLPRIRRGIPKATKAEAH